MLEGIKNAANERGVPYQSLIEVWLREKLEEVWVFCKHHVGWVDKPSARRSRCVGCWVETQPTGCRDSGDIDAPLDIATFTTCRKFFDNARPLR